MKKDDIVRGLLQDGTAVVGRLGTEFGASVEIIGLTPGKEGKFSRSYFIVWYSRCAKASEEEAEEYLKNELNI